MGRAANLAAFLGFAALAPASPVWAASPDWCAIMKNLPTSTDGLAQYGQSFAKISRCEFTSWDRKWFCDSDSWRFTLTPDAADGVVLTAQGLSKNVEAKLRQCRDIPWSLASTFDPGAVLLKAEYARTNDSARIAVIGPVDYGQTIVRFSLTGSPPRGWADGNYASIPRDNVVSAVRLFGTDPTLLTEKLTLDLFKQAGGKVTYDGDNGLDWHISASRQVDIETPANVTGFNNVHLFFKLRRLQMYALRFSDLRAYEKQIANLTSLLGPPEKEVRNGGTIYSWDEGKTGRGVMRVTASIWGGGQSPRYGQIHFLNPIIAEQADPIQTMEDEETAMMESVI